MEKNQTLFEFISMWALDNRMSLKEFAEKSDLTFITVLNTRNRKPSNKTYMKISDITGVKASELYYLPITKDE